MKITLSVNLGGYSFNIDEDAYEELKRYLKNLELHFASEESSSEILSDIETRMAELFRTKLTGYKQVITIQDVKEAIAVMGTPEDIATMTVNPPGINFPPPGITGCTAILITGLLVGSVQVWLHTGIWIR